MPSPAVARIAAQYQVPISTTAGGEPAFYPKSRRITIPASLSGPARSRAILHELGHASAQRVGRYVNWGVYRMDRRTRAREELVAEISAYKMAKKLGIPSTGGHSTRSYVSSWADQGYARIGRRNSRTRNLQNRGGYSAGHRTRGDASMLMADVDAVVRDMTKAEGKTARKGSWVSRLLGSEDAAARALPTVGGGN